MPNLDINNTFKRRSNSYRLVVTNDDTYDEVIAFRLTRKSVYIGFSIAFMFLVGLTIALIAFTPLKYYIPGYGTKESRSALELLKIRTDSLEQSIHYKEQYLEGLKKVLSEGNPKQLDTLPLQLPESKQSND
jgi:hypothetical protein